MFSKTSEYALRATVVLAGHPKEPILTPDLAAMTRVPPAYLAKVLQTLVRSRLVRSQRGQGGGFALARPPSEITVLEVIDAVDPIHRIESCPLEIEGHGDTLCPLHRRLDEAIALIQTSFAETSLSDIVGEEAALCRADEKRST